MQTYFIDLWSAWSDKTYKYTYYKIINYIYDHVVQSKVLCKNTQSLSKIRDLKAFLFNKIKEPTESQREVIHFKNYLDIGFPTALIIQLGSTEHSDDDIWSQTIKAYETVQIYIEELNISFTYAKCMMEGFARFDIMIVKVGITNNFVFRSLQYYMKTRSIPYKCTYESTLLRRHKLQNNVGYGYFTRCLQPCGSRPYILTLQSPISCDYRKYDLTIN